MDKRVLSQYFKSIERDLPGSRKDKKTFLQDFQVSIEDYLAENPDATLSELYGSFGAPQDICDSFYESEDPIELKKKLRRRHCALTLVSAVLLLTLALLTGWFVRYVYSTHLYTIGETVTSPPVEGFYNPGDYIPGAHIY